MKRQLRKIVDLTKWFPIQLTDDKRFTGDWHMAVGDFFKDELDIKYTQRKSNGKPVLAWTQGQPPLYSFSEGHVFYDTPKAYMQWAETLQYINVIIQIDSAVPDRITEDKGRVNGMITFSMYAPDKSRMGIEKTETVTVSQENFVHFLKTGEIRPMPKIHPEFS